MKKPIMWINIFVILVFIIVFIVPDKKNDSPVTLASKNDASLHNVTPAMATSEESASIINDEDITVLGIWEHKLTKSRARLFVQKADFYIEIKNKESSIVNLLKPESPATYINPKNNDIWLFNGISLIQMRLKNKTLKSDDLRLLIYEEIDE